MRHQRVIKAKTMFNLKRKMAVAEDNGWQVYGGVESSINPVSKQPGAYTVLMVRDMKHAVWGFLFGFVLPVVSLMIWISYS